METTMTTRTVCRRAFLATMTCLALTASGSGGGPTEGSVVGGDAGPAADGVALSADRQMLVLPKGKRVRVSGMTAKGAAPAAATEVTASWDDDGMTFVFECADTNLVSKWAEARDSEKTWKDDSVAVLLDLGHRHAEGENFVMFKLSAAGGLQDCRGKSRDIAFTVPGATSAIELPSGAVDARQILPPTAEQQGAAASTVPEGHWRGTIRIPWKGLGAKPAEDEVWGVNFTRIDQPGTTFMAWAPFDEQFEELRSFGHLVFAAADAPTDAKAAAARRESVKLAHARLATEYLNEGVSASVSRTRPAVVGEWGVIKTGARPKQATTASLAWGDGGLDVVFDCTDDGVVAAQEGRDNIKLWKDDSVYLFLDTGHSHNVERCWMIQVSASGACLDQRNNDPKVDPPGVTVKTERTDKGWRAHLGIPWQALGVGAPRAGEVWGLNLARMDQPGKLDYENMEMSSWAPLPEGDVSLFDHWGHLVFVSEGEGAKADQGAAEQSVKAAHDGRWRQMGPKPLD